MNPQEIVEALSHNHGKFPHEAMEAAIHDREAITPILLAELERLAGTGKIASEDADSYMLHIYAMYLLAQFRETRALTPLVRICHLPYEDVDFLLGDVVTEGLPAILASVCGGDTAPIKAIIESRNLDEFVRDAGMRALVTLMAEGDLAREAFIDYLKEFAGTLERETPMWNYWAYAADAIYPEELLPELRAAFDAKLIDPQWMSIKDIDRTLQDGRDKVLADLRKRNAYVNDAVAALEWWACFKQPERHDDHVLTGPTVMPEFPPLPYFREYPKVGRNDPCPCGSGKKYKKCCMSA